MPSSAPPELNMSGLTGVSQVKGEEGRPPNFLLLVGDDVGYNDVSWHNPAMSTPHLEALRREGVSLESFYSQPRCSPSRAALLTGLYPYRLGIQRGLSCVLQYIFLSGVFQLRLKQTFPGQQLLPLGLRRRRKG